MIRTRAYLGGSLFCSPQCLFTAHFKIVFCLFIIELFFIIYIIKLYSIICSEYKSLIRYMFCISFLPFHGCLSTFLMMSFETQKF